MRQKHTTQSSIFLFRPEHEICDYLDQVDRWLNQHPELLDWVSEDLNRQNPALKGRRGVTCEQVLRTAHGCDMEMQRLILARSLNLHIKSRPRTAERNTEAKVHHVLDFVSVRFS